MLTQNVLLKKVSCKCTWKDQGLQGNLNIYSFYENTIGHLSLHASAVLHECDYSVFEEDFNNV